MIQEIQIGTILRQALTSQIVPFRQLIPENEVVEFLGRIVVEAIDRMLKGKKTADVAVEITMDQALQR